jgi:hypothetical protein
MTDSAKDRWEVVNLVRRLQTILGLMTNELLGRRMPQECWQQSTMTESKVAMV